MIPGPPKTSAPATCPPPGAAGLLWRVPVVLNLLPPAVACCWVVWLASCYRLYVPHPQLYALALAVWLIYTLDGLLDARGRLPGSVGTVRRDFHWRHRKNLWLAWLLAGAILLAYALWNVGGGLVLACLLFGLPVALHLLHAQLLRHARHALIPKEVFGGFVFAMGVGLVVLEAKGQIGKGPVDPKQAAAAFAMGGGLGWWLRSSLFVFANVLADPAVPVLGVLFSVNCLLVGLTEARDGVVVDEASSARLSPVLAKWSPLGCAALAVSSAIHARSLDESGLSRFFLSVALAAALMLIVHQLARHRVVRGDLAALLFDVALLVPVAFLVIPAIGPF